LTGICPAAPSTTDPAFRDWLNSSALGSLEYLREHLEVRLDVTRLLRGARSVIVVGDVYAAREPEVDDRQSERSTSGRIARYARGDDYHDIIKKRLHNLCDTLRAEHDGHEFRAFTDIEPVLEREHAARAGLGWVGKNSMLIHPRLGSYFFLGGIVTTLALDPPLEQRSVPDHCGTCTRCIDACPTQAITPYRVDASRCISALTIEQRGLIDPSLHRGIGDWLYGCDVCQEVCPHNSPRPPEFTEELPAPGAAYAAHRASFDLLDILNWTPQDRTARLRKSAMKRATLEMWKRNAIIVAANLLRERDDPVLRSRLTDLAWDASESELARATARQVLGL
jgi:epoxyqueuosine reductase